MAGHDRAFTLVELFLTIGVLMMVLGLAINLAQHGRERSQAALTQAELRGLAVALDGYLAAHDGRGPAVPPAVPPTAAAGGLPAEADVRRAADVNDAAVVRALVPYWPTTGPAAGLLGRLPGPQFDGVTLRDAWGNPIIYLPGQHPAIGMAADDRPFFVSPGPDRLFLTRDDNLYSYEDAAENPAAPTAPTAPTSPTTRPAPVP